MVINEVSKPIPGETVPIPWQIMEVIHAKKATTFTSFNTKGYK